jgi:hypothetical protein
MQISLFRLFGFCNILKLVVDKKKTNWSQYKTSIFLQKILKMNYVAGIFFVIYLECFYGLSVINTN